MDSKVKFVQVDGVYDRGFTKRNSKEAEALVNEVIRRLQDPVLSRSSMGVVTFSGAQQNDIERLLTKEIAAKKQIDHVGVVVLARLYTVKRAGRYHENTSGRGFRVAVDGAVNATAIQHHADFHRGIFCGIPIIAGLSDGV